MNEDRDFLAFLRQKLEEGVAPPPVRLPPPRHAHRWRRLAIAAALALLCGGAAWTASAARNARLERRAAQTLDFLEIWHDSDPGDADGASFAERLLAWQDAPYAEIAADPTP